MSRTRMVLYSVCALAILATAAGSALSGTGKTAAPHARVHTLLTYVAARHHNSGPRDWRICAARSDGTHRVMLFKTPPASGLTWSPGGTRLAYSSRTDRAEGDVLVSNARLTRVANITRGFTNASWSPSWSPDGSSIAFVGGAEGSFAYVVSPDRGAPSRVPLSIPYVGGVDWFPGGGRLLIEAPFEHTGVVGLLSVGLDGGSPRELIPLATDAAISPDGSRVAFVRVSLTAAPQDDLYVANIDGSGEQRLTATSRASELDPAWSPDGKSIAFVRVRPVPIIGHRYRTDIGLVRSDGTHLHLILHSDRTDFSSPAWRAGGPLPVQKRARC